MSPCPLRYRSHPLPPFRLPLHVKKFSDHQNLVIIIIFNDFDKNRDYESEE